MQKIAFLFIILISLSCNNNEETIKFLDEGIVKCNKYLTNNNDWLYMDFEAANYENPKRIKKWKQKVDSINIAYSNIEDLIETIKVQIDSNQSIKLKKQELFIAVSSFKEMVNKTVLDSSRANDVKFDISIIQSNKLSIQSLNLLNNKLISSVHLVLDYLFEKIDYDHYSANKLYTVINPVKNYLNKDEYYESEIYLANIDTTFSYFVIVENDTLDKNSGIANYYVQDNDNIVERKFNGRIEFDSYIDTKINYPFIISYKVVSND